MKKAPCLVFALALASCTAEHPNVGENSLGITTLETTRSTVAGEPVFELRGFDADGNQVGSMRHRVGALADSELPGTEMTWTVQGVTDTMTTTSTTIEQTRVLQDKLVEFARISEVKHTIKAELGIQVVAGDRDADIPYTSHVDSCSTGEERSGGTGAPYAKACCRTKWDLNTAYVTFRRESDMKVADRFFGGGATKRCQMANGSTACAGDNNTHGLPRCDYGPCASQNPQMHTGPYVINDTFDGVCAWSATGPDWNGGGLWGSCGYTSCNNGTPVTGGAGQGTFDSPTPW